MKRLHRQWILVMALLSAGVLLAFVRILAPSPNLTEEERNEMSVLCGQLFVFQSETNVISMCPTMIDFERQSGMVPYLRLVASSVFQRVNWPKNVPVEIDETPDTITITWPFPPTTGKKPKVLWGPDFSYRAIIDKETKTVVTIIQGS